MKSFSLTNYLKKLQKGATLLELLIYMGILTVFMAVLATLFGTALDLQTEANATTSVDRDATYLFARIAYDLHRAESIVTPANRGAANSGASLTLSINGTNHTYAADAVGNFVYTNALGSFNLNSYDTTISNLVFTKISTLSVEETLRISFTLTSVFTPDGNAETRNFSTTLALRKQL